MMKMNKFKLYHPLIMAIFYFTLLIFFGYVHLVLNNPNLATVYFFEQKINLFIIIMIIVFIVFSTFIIVYTYYLQKNNKGKLNEMYMKPPEIDEEDEGSKFVYSIATKRVYIYYTSVIPLLTLVLLFFKLISFEVEMFILIFILLSILVIHYLIYYVTVRNLIK